MNPRAFCVASAGRGTGRSPAWTISGGLPTNWNGRLERATGELFQVSMEWLNRQRARLHSESRGRSTVTATAEQAHMTRCIGSRKPGSNWTRNTGVSPYPIMESTVDGT